jgi:ribonuclease BN (tRNA processing enzyme)
VTGPGLDVRFLGTGDAFGSGGRLPTATLLRGASGTLLVDCGPATLPALRGHGGSPEDVDAIVLTHLHGDHFSGIPFLLMDAHYASARTRPLVIVGPAGVEAAVARAHDVLFPGAGVLSFRFPLVYQEFEAGVPMDAGPGRVTPMPVSHSVAIPCFGVRIEMAGVVVAFTGDTEWTPTLPSLAAGADLFVCECFGFDAAPPHHLDFRTLTAHRSEFACRQLLLTHMGEEMLSRAAALGLATTADGLLVTVRPGQSQPEKS